MAETFESDTSCEWSLVDEVPSEVTRIDASCQVDIGVIGATLARVPPYSTDRDRIYVVWAPRCLAGVFIGGRAWEIIARELGGRYSYADGHRLCKKESLEAAQEIYRAESGVQRRPSRACVFLVLTNSRRMGNPQNRMAGWLAVHCSFSSGPVQSDMTASLGHGECVNRVSYRIFLHIFSFCTRAGTKIFHGGSAIEDRETIIDTGGDCASDQHRPASQTFKE